MLRRGFLKEKFAKDWKGYYQVELFREKGFQRKRCSCGKFFWTLDSERAKCGDSSCESYSFIGKPLGKKWDYVQAWEAFERFFSREGHTPVKRYPVVDRWRPDLYFTIASIQDFQRIDKGQIVMEYPADPLIVPQVCLRFSDIENVGVTGRHHTSFVMSGQHSFGNYWKDRCIGLNFEFLTKAVRIPEERLVYIEDLWAMPDLSQFGPSLETVSAGLELVNSVFSQFTKSGSSFKEMPSKVIDVGWGHERLVWFSQGTTTGYEAVFGPVIQWMKKQAGIKETEVFRKYSEVAGRLDFNEVGNIEKARGKLANELGIGLRELREAVMPLQGLYSIADHAKSLLFAVTDGGLPSNVGGGYNLRVILRRALSFMKEFGFDFDLAKIAQLHSSHLKKMFPELREGLERFPEIVELERERFERTMVKAGSLLRGELERGLDSKALVRLYTTHGISPEMAEKEGQRVGKPVKIPEDFYQQVTSQHMGGDKEEDHDSKLDVDLSSMPETDKLYYKDPFLKEMKARVLKAFRIKGSWWVALDRTVFYPEGGGQPADWGGFPCGWKKGPGNRCPENRGCDFAQD